jgi:3-deoxy-manno-octulosonate cytidylyltransferase (CMP-KDO synthetase)
MAGPSGHAIAPIVVGMIPARLGSTRFPNKVLAARTGKPLVQHVWENARHATTTTRLLVATDHHAVQVACEAFGAEVVLTHPDHPNGTSRLEEAARLLGLPDDAIVVNIQGDEPEMEPELLDAVVAACIETGAEVATIASPFTSADNPNNPAIVKVVLSQAGLALYFSRSCIPFPRDATACNPLRHVGLYAYRVGFLHRYVSLPATPLERSESLEQLRVLEHGFRIAVAVRPSTATGIDTPEQYDAFVARWQAVQRSA